MEEILKVIREALHNCADVESFSEIESEHGVIGVELADGREVFVKVEEA